MKSGGAGRQVRFVANQDKVASVGVVIILTVDSDVDRLGEAQSADPVGGGARVGSLGALVHGGDDEGTVRELVVGKAERKYLVVEGRVV